MGAGFHVPARFFGFAVWEDAVHDRLYSTQVNVADNLLQHGAAANENAHHASGAGKECAGLTSPPKPLTPPMMAIVPPMAAEATERLIVPCPPTSSTTFVPSLLVRSSRTRRLLPTQSGHLSAITQRATRTLFGLANEGSASSDKMALTSLSSTGLIR